MSDDQTAVTEPTESVSVSDEPVKLPMPGTPEAEPRPNNVEEKPESSEPASEAPEGEASENDQPDPEAEKKPPKTRFHERIKELNDKRRTAEAERDAAVQRLEQLQDSLKRPENFDEMDVDEQAKHEMRSAVREERVEDTRLQAEEAAKQAYRARAETFQTKVDAVRERIPDIDTVFDAVITDPMADILADSDNGAEMAYWLAKNPAENDRIARLPAHRQGVELARIESRVKPPENARKTTQTPAPVKTVGSSPGPGVKDPNEMSMTDYAAWRRSQMKKAG